MTREYGLFYLTAAISVFIVILVLQNTYLYTMMRNSRAALTYLFLQGVFILWAILRLTEAYAPTLNIKNRSMMFQFLLVVVILLLLLFIYRDSGRIHRIPILIILAAVISDCLMIITSPSEEKSLFSYAIPVIISELFTLSIWYQVRKELSGTGKLSLKGAIQSIGDIILVLDMKNRIMDANYSFLDAAFHSNKPPTYSEFCKQVSVAGITQENDTQLLSHILNTTKEQEIDFQLNQDTITCTCKAIPIFSDKADQIGMMLTFHDITPYRRLMKELEEKKRELTDINTKLQDYITVVSRLEEAKVIREISQRIQNSIGHEIMELLTMLEVVQIKTDKLSVQELELAVEACRKIIEKIRSSALEIEKFETEHII